MEVKMAKSVKLADIAKELGVSTVTVSNALLGKKGVSDRMRELIWKKAKEMGYVKSAMLSGQQEPAGHFHIAVLVSERHLDKKYSFYWQIYQNLATLISKNGHFTILEIISNNDEQELVLPHILPEENIDGIIVIGEMKKEYLVNVSQAVKVPALCLGFYQKGLKWDAVIADDFFGMDVIVEYLFSKNIKKLAFIGNIYDSENNLNRYMGFMRAMLRHHAEQNKDWMFLDNCIDISEIANILAKDSPQGVVCISDKIAEQLITAFQKNGIHVPEDVSVTGYENFCFDWKLHEHLTTYDVDTARIAEDAIHVLVDRITGQITSNCIRVVPGCLVIRGSVISDGR